MPAFRASEVIGAPRHPVFQAFEQGFANFLAALGAARFLKETLGRRIDAALGNDLQAIDRLAERQGLGVQDHRAGTVANGVGHAIAGATAGGQLFLDDVLAHQPTHDRPGPGLMHRQRGDFRDDDALRVHGASLLHKMDVSAVCRLTPSRASPLPQDLGRTRRCAHLKSLWERACPRRRQGGRQLNP
ncbi:hypothetical protein D3C86_1413820 [compost metagenome]